MKRAILNGYTLVEASIENIFPKWFANNEYCTMYVNDVQFNTSVLTIGYLRREIIFLCLLRLYKSKWKRSEMFWNKIVIETTPILNRKVHRKRNLIDIVPNQFLGHHNRDVFYCRPRTCKISPYLISNICLR